jgi:hypothetical protein
MLTGRFHLTLAKNRGTYNTTLTARITKNRPALQPGEVSLVLDVEVPAALFARPALSAKVTVPPSQALSERITAEVQDNLAEILAQQLGMHVSVSAADPEA